MPTKNESNNRDHKGNHLSKLELIQLVLNEPDKNEEYKLLWISQIIDWGKIKNTRMKIQDIILSEQKTDSEKVNEIREILTKEELKPLSKSISWIQYERELFSTWKVDFKEYEEVKKVYPKIPKGKTSPFNHVWRYFYPWWVILRKFRHYSIPRASQWISKEAKIRFGETPSIKTIEENMQRIDKALKLK